MGPCQAAERRSMLEIPGRQYNLHTRSPSGDLTVNSTDFRRRFAPALLMWAMAGVALCAPGETALPSPATDEQAAKLIAQLGDDDYFVRQRAQDELARLGFDAFDALSEATLHEDLEIAARAKYLLRLMQVEWTREDDPPLVKEILENYGWLAPEGRQSRIETLATLPDAAGVSALCRIVRFEQTNEVSKQAALAILGMYPADETPSPEVIRTIRQTLHGSRRPGAHWLLTWAEKGNNPAALVEDFARFIDEEQASLKRPAFPANTDTLAALLRFQVAWLERLDRREQAIGAMRRLLALEEGEIDDLRKLFHWLIDQKAWSLVDELVARFDGQIRRVPVLLYLLAETQAEQGKTALAEKTAEQALSLRPAKNRSQLNERRALAMELWQRGRPDWAKREFRYVLDNGVKGDIVTILTQHSYARMLHDRGEVREAAEVLKELVDHFAKNPDAAEQMGIDSKATSARMHYFYACHYQTLKDYAKQREHLDKALADDPDELDALIARYHLPDQSDEYRRKTMEMIQAAVDSLRDIIAGDPEEAAWYNQLAWLVGNTEGDLDEALKCSQKSLELSPNEGAYYDTLAHVYFARKDYANAVKFQKKAVEQDAYSKLIRDKLEVFQAAAEASKAQ